MNRTFERFARIELAPPRYLSQQTAGIDISTSGVKIAFLKEKKHGIELVAYDRERFQTPAVSGGEIREPQTVIDTVRRLAQKNHIKVANIAVSESRGYLFEAKVDGTTPAAWRAGVERRLDEFVPLPPAEVAFDTAPIRIEKGQTELVGVGYARRVVDELLGVFDAAGVEVHSVESEVFSLPRALLPHGDTSTVLLIDIGKTTTKLLVVSHRLPRFGTTLDIGGHALTLAVQKHFGVTEDEAKRVKAEKGLVASDESGEYVAAMLSTVSAIREEIVRRLDYWQTHAGGEGGHERVTRVILIGGNATVRGLPEYLEAALKVPVDLGDVFTNLAPKSEWLPPIDYMESLAFGTAIGLALREYVP